MKLISRTLFLDNMYLCEPEVTMGEDLSIMLPVMLDADRIVVVEKGLYYHYRFMDSSMVHQYSATLYGKVQLLYRTLDNVLRIKKEGLPTEIDWTKSLKQEYLFLLLQVIKNELRSPHDDYREQIKKISEETLKDLEEVKIEVRKKANKLLYWIFIKPVKYRIIIGRFCIKIFDHLF